MFNHESSFVARILSLISISSSPYSYRSVSTLGLLFDIYLLRQHIKKCPSVGLREISSWLSNSLWRLGLRSEKLMERKRNFKKPRGRLLVSR